MERQILKMMLKRQFWTNLKGPLDLGLFGSDVLPLVETVQNLFQQYPTLEEMDMEQLLAVYEATHVLTTAKRTEFRILIRSIFDEDEPDPALTLDILNGMRVKEIARQVSSVSIDIINGEHQNFDRILELIENGNQIAGKEQVEALTTDIAELLQLSSPENLFQFRLSTLQDKVLGAGRQNLIIIFGRPEVGKSSFTAHCVVGHLQQGLTVDYYANEEPTHKIQLNMVRSAMNMTDTELREGSDFTAWNDIRERIRVYDAVGLNMEDLQRRCAGTDADVIVLDQADKVDVSGNFDSPTEKIKERYVKIREVAKRNNKLLIAVSQASADAQNKRFPTFDMLENSKTGKAGEADMIIGVGHNPQIDAIDIRHICVSKNKINGWKGNITVGFDHERNQFTA